MATPSTIIDIDRDTGEFIQGWPRCRKAIITIVTTRLKTRLMRLAFGSNVPRLQDKPGNEFVILEAFHEIADPINRWEPEFRVTKVILEDAGPTGRFAFLIEGTYLPDQTSKSVQVTL